MQRNAEQHRDIIAQETEEDRRARLQRDTERIARETEDDRRARLRRRENVRALRYLNLGIVHDGMNININIPASHDLGPFRNICEHCGAMKFADENHFKC